MVKYDIELLKSISERDGCKIDFEFYVKVKLDRNSEIDYICKCGQSYRKEFRPINTGSGGFCNKCKKKTKKYTIESLKNIVVRDNCKIDLEIYEKEHLHCKSYIDFKCSCDTDYSKRFDNIIEVGAFCKACTKDKRNEKFLPSIRATFIEKYGSWVSQSEEVKAKIKDTNMQKYGVQYGLSAQSIKDKIKDTVLEKYGVEHIGKSDVIRAKIKETTVEKYGVDNPGKVEKFRDKMKQTTLERYGVEHNMQDPLLAEKCFKSGHKFKPYIMPSGQEVLIQGYEHFALDELLYIEKLPEEDIVLGKQNVPEIWYYQNGKNHRYYIDIYIPSQNKCIEVKSSFTNTRNIEKNRLKADAVTYLGYEFELRVYDDNGKQIN